ncbi:MAG: sterol desaturase family protein, partial [Owenweeksia sp.]
MNTSNPLDLPFMDTCAFPILVSVFIAFTLLEFFIVLRPWQRSRWKRWVHNSLIALIGLPAARLLLLPATVALAYYCSQTDIGLLNLVELPSWAEWTIGLLVLDYAIYLWHRANHIFPFLWRFHNVHHIDLEMDISTGIRFHIGEMLLSIPFRCIVILLSGVSPMMLLIYEVIFEAATLFHHSNIRLPLRLERFLVQIVVTPRMHGIHHSIVEQETNSNFSTVLNVWDRLHQTRYLKVKQDALTLGVPAYRGEK